VIDDSKEAHPIDGIEYIHTDFDIGVSAGRNLGVKLAKTKYVFTCDDDNIVIESTDLAKAEQLIREYDIDLLGVKEINNSYYGLFAWDGDTVRYIKGDMGKMGKVTLYDFVPNLWIAKTDALRKYQWDEYLKTGEHFAYFLTHKGKLRVGFTDAVSMGHAPTTNPTYAPMRDRASEYVLHFMRQNGIKKRIDLFGNEVCA
jgi:hypothetical protein